MPKAQLGLMIEGQMGLTWPRWQRILRTAEDAGYQCVFRSDHFTNPQPPHQDSLELWVSLTYAASHTQRIEFGPLVAPTTFRHPSMTARMAAAVDDLSGGRLVLGLGAGWQVEEHQRFGVPFYDFPTRFDMLTEALELTRLLFDSDTPVEYAGQHFPLTDAVLLPRPARKGGPPILIGGRGPKRTLPLVAQHAHEWNTPVLPIPEYRERAALLDTLLAERGRAPGEVRRSLMVTTVFARSDAELDALLPPHWKAHTLDELAARGLIVGTASRVIDQLSAWTEAGVERFMLQWLDLDALDRVEALARDVLPHFHG